MKLKTHKATAKRFRVAKKGKSKNTVMKRACGQNHFNSRESGKVGRNKKSDANAPKTLLKVIKANLA